MVRGLRLRSISQASRNRRTRSVIAVATGGAGGGGVGETTGTLLRRIVRPTFAGCRPSSYSFLTPVRLRFNIAIYRDRYVKEGNSPMWSRDFRRFGQMFERGDLKYVILEQLKDK